MLMETDLLGQIPLHYAARNNAAVAAHYLAAFMLRFLPTPSTKSKLSLSNAIDLYASLNTPDVQGKTPLHYSVDLVLS